MNTIKAIGKYISLFMSWVIFSPFYFWLSKKFSKQSVWTRSIWTFFSPFTIILVLLYFPLKELVQYTSRSTIHRITKAELPFKYIYDINGFLDLSLRDHTTTYYACFLSMPTEVEYAQLDSLCREKQSYWSKSLQDKGEVYSYSRGWGNGIEAPEGENELEDRFFNISFVKGSKEVQIQFGSW